MELKNMNIEYDIDSAHTDIEKKAFCRINALNLAKKNHCSKCGGNIREKEMSSKLIYEYCSEPIVGDAHLYRVDLATQRYKCLEPNCGCTFAADELPRDFTYTDSFKEYIGFSILSNENMTFSKLERNLSLSHSFVTNIFNNYIKNLNLHFTPHRNRRYLYLHEFYYKDKKRCYLVKVTNSFKPHIVAFFGYEDCDNELIEYFRFHWKEPAMSDQFLTLYTERTDLFYSSLSPFVRFLIIKPSRIKILELLNSKIYNTDETLNHAIKVNINALKKCLLSKSYKHYFKVWWSDILKDTKHKNIDVIMEPVREFLIEHPHYHEYYKEFDIDFKPFNKSISNFESQNLSFENMCARLMYKTQGNYLFENDEFNHAVKYDKNNNLFYRDAVLDDEEFEQLHHKRNAELLKQLDETKKSLHEKAEMIQEQLELLDEMYAECYSSDDDYPFDINLLNDDFSKDKNDSCDLIITEDIDEKIDYINNQIEILMDEIDKYRLDMKNFKRKFKNRNFNQRLSYYSALEAQMDNINSELRTIQMDFDDVDYDLFEGGYKRFLKDLEFDDTPQLFNDIKYDFFSDLFSLDLIDDF